MRVRRIVASVAVTLLIGAFIAPTASVATGVATGTAYYGNPAHPAAGATATGLSVGSSTPGTQDADVWYLVEADASTAVGAAASPQTLSSDPQACVFATVTFNLNGSTSAIDPAQVQVGQSLVTPTPPGRTGYTFKGWFTSSSGGTKWYFTNAITGDLTLYAQWTAVEVEAPKPPQSPKDPEAPKAPEVPQAPSSFKDVSSSHPFHDSIMWMASQGISTGYADGTYRAGDGVSRQAMAAFLYRAAGEPNYPVPSKSPFKDVSTSHPFFEAIAWMDHAGISTGYADGTYRPGDRVSRQAMSAFLYRAADEPAFDAPSSSAFKDVSSKHPFSREIAWMATTGISNGYSGGTYRPEERVSRQAMSAFLYRLSELAN